MVYIVVANYIMCMQVYDSGQCIDVAPGPAGPAPAGPLFAQETDFMKVKAGQFAHTSRLRGEGVTTNQEVACKLT